MSPRTRIGIIAMGLAACALLAWMGTRSAAQDPALDEQALAEIARTLGGRWISPEGLAIDMPAPGSAGQNTEEAAIVRSALQRCSEAEAVQRLGPPSMRHPTGRYLGWWNTVSIDNPEAPVGHVIVRMEQDHVAAVFLFGSNARELDLPGEAP